MGAGPEPPVLIVWVPHPHPSVCPKNTPQLEKERDKELEGDKMPKREELGELIRGKGCDSISQVS